MFSTSRCVVSLLLVVSSAFAQATSQDDVSHGMDMNMDMGMQLASGQMIPYLHFQGGDVLWFQGWVPQSRGAIAGACLGLFLLAIFDRWLATMRSVAEVYWNKRAEIGLLNKLNTQGSGKTGVTLAGVLTLRTIPPFIPSHDIARGVLHSAQSFLSFAFMLAAMTFNAGIIVAMVVGFGVGETLFGRYAASRSSVHQ
ncbi:Protein P80 [Leucoagaricus sp. SymC.cos]|nr:Protein P80 [Leucoagaricus sp. SymC.cos]